MTRAYRDGTAHDLPKLEAARRAALDVLDEDEALSDVRERLQRRITSTVDARLLAADLRAVDEHRESKRFARSHRRSRRRVRVVLAMLFGLPLLGGGIAVARWQPDCTEPCFDEGACHPQGEQCVVLSDDDCKQSAACGARGRCTLGHGTCVVGSSADCEQSGVCLIHNRCSRDDDTCALLSDDDCRLGGACAHGDCLVALDPSDHRHCVSAEDLRTSGGKSGSFRRVAQ